MFLKYLRNLKKLLCAKDNCDGTYYLAITAYSGDVESSCSNEESVAIDVQ